MFHFMRPDNNSSHLEAQFHCKSTGQTMWFTLSLIRFWTLLSWWIFYTSADLLLFVPLSRHLASSSPPHPSPNISFTFLCFFGLSFFLLVLMSPVFGVFLYVRNKVLLFNNIVQGCFRCDSKFINSLDWFVLCSDQLVYSCVAYYVNFRRVEDAHQKQAESSSVGLGTETPCWECWLTFCSDPSVGSPLTKAFHWGRSKTIWAALVVLHGRHAWWNHPI